MVQLFRENPWVENLMLTIGKEIQKNAAWGLWFRMIAGSGMSMLDLAIRTLRTRPREGRDLET